MAATLQQHCTTNANAATRPPTNTASSPNPQLKRLVYSKYRELLGSYNDQANAYIDTLPSYMVHKDTGFNLEIKNPDILINSANQNGSLTTNHNNEMYGSGQRMPAQQTYEAPACVQNAMMLKEKKPFTYTPGGIDLSQIKSERMAKRLARNAQAEGATGIQQQNRPTQPQSPGSSPSAAACMGAAAMGMPFQVLPPPPPPAPGKNFNGGSAPAPPPPPLSSSNLSNTGTLAPPTNGSSAAGGRGSAPTSPSMPRKSPTPQRFEPPPMGFRPEIKIPPNPMAALRKVPPPVEKNTFWKDEYVKDRSKSPMVEVPSSNASSNNTVIENESVDSASSSPQTTAHANINGTAALNNNDDIDGLRKTIPTMISNNNALQQNQTNNNNYTNNQPSQPTQQIYTPPSPPQQSTLNQQGNQISQPTSPTTTQQQKSSKPEFRSVAPPTPPAVNIYTRQSDSPRFVENATPPRATESPFKFAQQQQQQQRTPPAVSPLAQQSTPSSASSGASVSNQAQTVPWRNQRGQSQPQQAPPVVAQSHPQPMYNNVQQQQQHQRAPDFSTQQSAYQGPKPTNVGSLYIAPLAPPTEPQAQHIVRQQMQQQQQQRESPMRQMAPSQQQQQPNQQLRWMSTQPMAKEQPAWARPEENGNIVPSSLIRIKSPPPAQAMQQPLTQQMHQPLSQGNGFMPLSAPQNFGAHQQLPINTTGLRLQINTPVSQSNSQNGPKERIIPIQLEQTPTYTPAQPSFNQPQQLYGASGMPPAPGYVVRTPNQFVDQGYNNFGQQQQQQHQSQPQRGMSPNLQQLNAPRIVQQTQNNVATANKTHIIPISLENSEGTRGPISKTPIVIQNDQRTTPVQSKSFRILQKITDTIDNGSNDVNANQQQQQQQLQQPVEPQLQRPTFARQMSAQQARHSPTVEQMRRMQIGHEQGNYSAPTTPSALNYNQQRSLYDNSQQYVPPSEQQVPEPKKYTGSAIPSRSFKILQAMTQPENADEQETSQNHNERNEIESKPEYNRHFSYASNTSNVEPASSCSSSSINSELALSSSPSPTPPPSQPLPYPSYPYPYGYPWYPPPHHVPTQNGESFPPSNWHYPYGMHSATPHPLPVSEAGDQTNPPTHYQPYPFYYPYYPPPPHMPTYSCPQNKSNSSPYPPEFDFQNGYSSYMPPPPPYLAYPYPVAPCYSQSSSSSRASSVLPDIIITPSTDDVPSKVIMKHNIKLEKDQSKRGGSVEIEDVTSFKSNSPADGSVVDILTQHLSNMTKSMENNLNTKRQAKKLYKKNINQKSPEDNTSPVQITMVMTESEKDSEIETSDSEITPKQMDNKVPVPLRSIKSVNNVQIYNGQKFHKKEEDSSSESESEDEDDDDETTADNESDIFDEDDGEENHHHDFKLEEHVEQEDSDSEEIIVDDNLSVIYEEESEMEKSSDMAKTVIRGDRSSQSDDLTLDKDDTSDDLQQKIEENDDDYDAEAKEKEREDSTSVTVRLPLKFSFSTSKDAENITTVEVGKSQVEERRNSISLSEKRNSFSVATVKSDTEDEDECDDCDVSVTISLTNSSRSSSVDNEIIVENTNIANLYPIEDMPLPEEALEEIKSSQEDVSVSFSLNMRNKFANETLKDGITNNIAMIRDVNATSAKEEVKKVAEAPEEIDFFATLMATKMQAQKIKEQSASYWGQSTENKDSQEGSAEKIQKEKTQEAFKKPEDNTERNESKLNVWEKYSKKESLKESIIQEVPKLNTLENPKKVETNTKSKEDKLNSRKKYSSKTKVKTSSKTVKENKKEKTIEDILEKKPRDINKPETSSCTKTKIKPQTTTKSKEDENVSLKHQEEIKKHKFSFWDRCSTTTKEESMQVKKTEEVPKKRETDSMSALKTNEVSISNSCNSTSNCKQDPKLNVEECKTFELEDIGAPRDQEEVVRKTESSSANKEAEEIVDIWADRVEDLPPIKPIKSKLKSLETAKNSFWSTFSDANQTIYKTEQVKERKTKTPLQKPETISKVEFNMKVLRSFVKQEPQPETATVHYIEEVVEEPTPVSVQEVSEEIDFWAQIKNARDIKTPEPIYSNSYGEQKVTTNDLPLINSFGEQETSMYNDDSLPDNTSAFDPLKYPEEPREVDTDEEIDFWAEIEAKRQSDDEDVTFHRSASFWASRERHNSVDETPYKPVLPKAFHAKLPDEPPTENINIWETLKAHKGEEPVIVDPEMEEEKALAQEYDKMAEQEIAVLEQNDDIASVYEPVVASVWGPPTQVDQKVTETDMWATVIPQPDISLAAQEQIPELKPEKDELEVKRSNYRKAMAFFTTSIDENKDQSNDRFERCKSKSNRTSLIEEEADQWDWDAVNEALQQNNEAKNNEVAVDVEFNKEPTPQEACPINEIIKEEENPLPEVYVEPTLKLLPNGLPDLEVNKFNEKRKLSVKDRISAFETGAVEKTATESRRNSIKNQSLSVDSYTRQSSLSRNSSTQRSESEMDEDDSGVTDMNKQLSETDTESEGFPELRKMSSYQRAATHSRLFKLLQDDPDVVDSNLNADEDEFQLKPSRRKIVHNVSITRKQNPKGLDEAETMSQRRERLSLPLRKNSSIDADNPSTPNSPASPIMGLTDNKSSVVSDKLVSELVQSLLLKSDSTHFRKLPMEKLQAAAKRVLEEELDSLENTSVDSTPAITPSEIKRDKSYADYYNTWSDAQGSEEIVPSKSFRSLQDSRRTPWTARCPRVLSSKTINRDLSRVTESPEIFMRTSKSPECFTPSRERSIGKWKKS